MTLIPKQLKTHSFKTIIRIIKLKFKNPINKMDIQLFNKVNKLNHFN